jgi:hypothetical protein
MDKQEPSKRDSGRDPIVEFLKDAHAAGFLNNELATTLHYFHKDQVARRSPAAAIPPPAPATPVPEPEPHSALQPTPPRQPEPAPRPASQPKPQPAAPAPQPAPAFTPAPPRRSQAEVWARFAKMRSKKLWGTFTADFAANALTYLGVLLSVVVIYVFFAFGYFGETVDDEHKYFRPLVEIGVVAFFLGLAWVLRHRSGVPQTSTAIEMIGIVLAPVMLSASFRDGCTPSYRPWCLPPDVDGPGRWAAYAGAGLIATVIYYLYARRRAIYAYLVGPMLWTSLGAFALYLEDGIPLFRNGDAWRLDHFTRDGISAPQLITVLAGIGLTIAAASRVRHTRLGRLLAVPTVRAGVFFTPFVLALSLVFSYNDAFSSGVATPNLTDLAWPNVIATAIAAAVFATASNATFAWESLGKRVRRDTALVLQVAAYLSIAASWLLTAGFGVSPAWLGAGLIGYAMVVALFDRFLVGPRVAATWIVRTALGAGAALSLLEPGPTLAAWGTLGGIGVLGSAIPAVGTRINRFVPEPEDADLRLAALWGPLLVAVGAGATRLGWPDATPLVLLGAGGVFAAARLLPTVQLRTFAGVPAVLAGAGALGVEIWRQTEGIGFEPYALSGFLIGLAVLTLLSNIPAPARGGAVVVLLGAAAMIALREYIGSGAWDTAWIDTTVLAAAGLALVAWSLAGGRDGLFYGILGHGLVIAATVRSLWFEETAILGLSVLVVAHIAEAVNIELGRDGVVPRLARLAGPGGEAVRTLPTLVAAVTLVPLTQLIGRQIPFIADERSRFGPVLAGLSWVYLAGAVQRLERARRIAVPFAYMAGLTAVAVSAPSIMASLLTTLSAAAVTALLAFRSGRPYATLLSWMLGVAAALLAAYRVGVAGADLYLVLHWVGALLVVVPALIILWQRRAEDTAESSGVTSSWLVPPVCLGMLLLPASLAMAIAAGGWVAWIAVITALAYAAIGLATRAGGVAIPVAAAMSIAYASILYDNEWAHPFDQPLVWMPLAAAFIGVAALLPGNRRWRLLLDPAPGLVISGLGIGALSGAYSHPAGVLDIALVGCTVLLAAVYVIRAEEPWLIASGFTLIAAGLVAGEYWAPAATLGATLVTGYFADRKRTLPTAAALRAAAVVGVAATFGLTGVWLEWSASELVMIAGIGAVLTIGGAVALTIATSWPARLVVWTTPVHAIGHGLAVTSYLAAVDDLSGATPYGLATLLLLLEATAFGIIGTARRWQGASNGAAGFIAGAFVLFGYWQHWSTHEAIAYTAITGAALSILTVAGFLAGGISDRLRMWLGPVLALGQAAGVAVVAMAVATLEPSEAAGVAAGVLAFEAVLAGSAGTIIRSALLATASAGLAAAAYGLVPQWLGWTRIDFIVVTAAVAGLLAITATIVTERRQGRWALWIAPLHGLTIVAVAAIAGKTLATTPGADELWILSAVAFGFASYLAVNAPAAPTEWNVRTLAVAFFISAAGLAVGAEVARDGAVFAAALVVAAAGLVIAVGAGLLANTASTWRVEASLLSAGLLAVALGGVASRFDPLGVEMGTLLVVVGAALAGYGLLAHNVAVIEGAMVVWLGALMILVNQRMELTLHAAVIIVSVTLLATVELERYRCHLAEEVVPDGLHHLEWVLMLAPLTLAVADMFESLWFGLALFAEGALLAVWGAFTEVRRRALLGVGAMVGAIVLSVIIPAMHGISAGLTGGTWLVIGAIAATFFIIAGSSIERRRHAIGRQLAHIAEILEDWE